MGVWRPPRFVFGPLSGKGRGIVSNAASMIKPPPERTHAAGRNRFFRELVERLGIRLPESGPD
jgi:hypothetical protein